MIAEHYEPSYQHANSTEHESHRSGGLQINIPEYSSVPQTVTMLPLPTPIPPMGRDTLGQILQFMVQNYEDRHGPARGCPQAFLDGTSFEITSTA